MRETQNVRVFLPLVPVQLPNTSHEAELSSNPLSFDEVIDYSRCSIASFMPIFVEVITKGQLESEWKEAFQKVVPNLVERPADACLTVS